jgi:hypothetical protein
MSGRNVVRTVCGVVGAILLSGCVPEPGEPPTTTTTTSTTSTSTTSTTLPSGSDATPPAVTSVSVSPIAIDTSGASATVTVSLHATDEFSGVHDTSARFRSPSGQLLFVNFAAANLAAGTALDGTYTQTVTVPRYSEQGTWNLVLVSATDNATNTRGYTGQALLDAVGAVGFTQTGTGDTAPPQAVSASVSPSTVDTSTTAATISVTVLLIDDFSGTQSASLRFVGPSGQLLSVNVAAADLVGGSALDGTYTKTATVPLFAEQGSWTLTLLTVVDQATNTRSYTGQALIDAVGSLSFQNASA